MYLVISLLILRAGIWDLIVSVLDHYLPFYLETFHFNSISIRMIVVNKELSSAAVK